MIWTAEFASQGWLYDLTPYVESIKDRFIPAPLETATYEGKIWGSPQYTNSAFIYYRTDKVDAGAGHLAGRLQAGGSSRAASSSRARPTRA